MKIELFDHVENTDRPLSTIYEERLRFAAAVDGAGFYCLHVAEHHTGLHPRTGREVERSGALSTFLSLAPNSCRPVVSSGWKALYLGIVTPTSLLIRIETSGIRGSGIASLSSAHS